MKKTSLLLAVILLLHLAGCSSSPGSPQIVAATKPVYDFTSYLCAGTGVSVGLLIDQNVSCLHDYSLNVSQVRMTEAAKILVLSGAGLEAFMSDLLLSCETVIDSSAGISLLECEEAHDHHHEADAHIWLSPENAKRMVQNIFAGLCAVYPRHQAAFQENLNGLLKELDALQAYGEETLSHLSCRELVTFHDGFGYFAHAFGLTVAAAMEEESGSEASARELISLIDLMRSHQIPCVFTETNGSVSAAGIISSELNVPIYTLNMGMSGDYFEIMRQNIDTVKEALG